MRVAASHLDSQPGLSAEGDPKRQRLEATSAARTYTDEELFEGVSGLDSPVKPSLAVRVETVPGRVFLSYRVKADAQLVERLYDKLRIRGVDVWWDAKCLPPGQPWEEGFADGLLSSDVFVPVLSKSALAPLASLSAASTCDNVLLEYRMALELKARSHLRAIFPVLVGEMEQHSIGALYGDFFRGGMPNCADVVVASVEDKLSFHLQRAGMGPMQCQPADRTVKGSLGIITGHQGVKLVGLEHDVMEKAVIKIGELVKAGLSVPGPSGSELAVVTAPAQLTTSSLPLRLCKLDQNPPAPGMQSSSLSTSSSTAFNAEQQPLTLVTLTIGGQLQTFDTNDFKRQLADRLDIEVRTIKVVLPSKLERRRHTVQSRGCSITVDVNEGYLRYLSSGQIGSGGSSSEASEAETEMAEDESTLIPFAMKRVLRPNRLAFNAFQINWVREGSVILTQPRGVVRPGGTTPRSKQPDP